MSTQGLLIIFLALLSGCASVKPFAELSIGAQMNGSSDELIRTDRKNQCDKNVQFRACAGIELPDDWMLAYCHQSWLLCGGPFNERPELYTDDIRITKKFGGYKP